MKGKAAGHVSSLENIPPPKEEPEEPKDEEEIE